VNGQPASQSAARLQAKAMAGKITKPGYARLWARARARGQYPLLVCKVPPYAGPDAARPAGPLAWPGPGGLTRREPEPEA